MTLRTVKLGEVCLVKRGATITEKQAVHGDIPVVAGGLTYSYTHNKANRQANVITISSSGASAGYVNFWDRPIFASDCSTVESVDNAVDIRFIFHLLKSKQNFIYQTMRSGAAQPHVYAKDIAQITFDLPSQGEQRRIAKILDSAELIKLKRELVVQKLDGLAQSVFVEMFGDPLTNDKNLNQINLGDGITLFGGAAFKSADYVSDGIPLIRIGEVNRKEFDGANTCYLPQNFEKKYSRFLVRKNSLLMSLTGTTGKDDYGNVVLLDGKKEKYFLNQRVAFIEPNHEIFINEFLYHLLRNKEVKNQIISKSRGVRQANISNGDITSLLVIHPAIEEQLKFKKVVDGINYLADYAKSALTLDAKLILSLHDNLLTSRGS